MEGSKWACGPMGIAIRVAIRVNAPQPGCMEANVSPRGAMPERSFGRGVVWTRGVITPTKQPVLPKSAVELLKRLPQGGAR